MKESRQQGDWTTVPENRSGPRAVASFVWTDTETEDELVVEVRGCETFFEQLRLLGFERFDHEAASTGNPTTPRRSPDVCRHVRMDVTPAQKEQRVRRGA